MTDMELIDQFVAHFPIRDDQVFREFSLRGGITPQDVESLLVEPWNEHGVARWRPKRVDSPVSAVEAFYRRVPGRLPVLYEQMILRYQWGEAVLGAFRLLPNYPPSLEGLVKTVQSDSVMFRVLSAHGLVQFGKGPEMDYDPICFDLNKRCSDGDCAIVKADHEQILNHESVRLDGVFAGSFRELVLETVAAPRS
jgi:hypothetical protein